ncbi:hypothetical protein FB565_002978 [Actinoplanes lutulentus]|uniref:Transcriptional regulator n=1 Tax=Actinoplanes lutulentus TaxID=1287878 RepID=A0A327Z1N3_9ACTN|nr:hypothetical protein [Actinoplanes lutulentus]MBB2943265.1 hypothetical protein [Actinoplanes lutulentus]RAK28326.1 hypothetical protein B0I29_12094 [Actinoplanes lutulentus]
MGDHDRVDHALKLLAHPAAYAILLTLHERGGAATFVSISAQVSTPARLLRAMVAAELVACQQGGTLDVEPVADAQFCFTAKGEAIFGHLMRLRQWLDAQPARAEQDRRIR